MFEPTLLTFRSATLADLRFLLQLRLATIDRHLKAQGIVYNQGHHIERVLDHFSLSQILVYQEQRVGVIKVERTHARMHLMQLQVLPEFQNKGIGSFLVNQLITEAKRKNCRLTLKVLKLNPAKALYQRLGFIDIAEGDIDFEMVYSEISVKA